ncbi:hypothetical protein SCLCIDRAFT_129092, partial [Scleroderma citrinum Foug A]
RAIHINLYILEVRFNLSSLYESCNNQILDAIDAYACTAELNPGNLSELHLHLLKNAHATGSQLPTAPGPQDIHPTAYANPTVPLPGLTMHLSSVAPLHDFGLPPSKSVTFGSFWGVSDHSDMF